MNGKQGGDPAKLSRALVQLVALDEPPLRWIAGADAVAAVEQKARDLLPRPTLTANCHPHSNTTTPESDARSRTARSAPRRS